MTKTQLRVLKDVLDKAKRRAASTANDGERLWLHTWIIPPLEEVLLAAAMKHFNVSEFSPKVR